MAAARGRADAQADRMGTLIRQGDLWWADLEPPLGSKPGYRRPVVVVQSDRFNRSPIATTICVAVTTNLRWAGAPGNVVLPARSSGLPADSIANVTQIGTYDKEQLSRRVGRVTERQLADILAGIDLVLGR